VYTHESKPLLTAFCGWQAVETILFGNNNDKQQQIHGAAVGDDVENHATIIVYRALNPLPSAG
jgi:hypothetical protein